MSRFVKWVTLTPEERQQAGGAFPLRGQHNAGSGPLIKSHSGMVTLPNGQSCPVEYARYGARSHRFAFRAPVQQQLWYSRRLSNSIAAIEEQAQTLAKEAFRLAQQQEQKEARRRTSPPGQRLPPPAACLYLSPKTRRRWRDCTPFACSLGVVCFCHSVRLMKTLTGPPRS